MSTREVPVVSVRAALLGGLLAESAETAGLTSFTSAMWMRGTRNRGAADFARAVENLAAEVDSYSGRSSLGVTLECTADKLEPTLDLFAEALLEPAFDPTELERERRDVLASIERRVDRLAQRCFHLFQRTLFERHPYRLPISGLRESVEGFDIAAVRAHHERLIRADNLVLGVAGDVDPDWIAQACSVRFAALAEATDRSQPAAWPEPEPAPSEPRIVQEHADRAQAHFVLGFQGLALDDPDRFALELLAQILAGQSGRLFLELRDRQGLAYSVSAMNIEGVAPGFFSVYIATAPEKLDQARRGIEIEIERLVQEPVSAAELDRARRYLIGNHAIDRQRSAARAASLALDGRYGLGTDAALRYPEQIEALTREDLLRVAQRVMRFDARVEAAICP
jgi:zinc protease